MSAAAQAGQYLRPCACNLGLYHDPVARVIADLVAYSAPHCRRRLIPVAVEYLAHGGRAHATQGFWRLRFGSPCCRAYVRSLAAMASFFCLFPFPILVLWIIR